MDLNKFLDEMAKNAIQLKFNQEEKECKIGSSKFGGNPDLPSNFEWYYYEGTSFDDVKAKRPLSFLAQINCAEVSKYDEDSLLPNTGILYFFYEMETMTWGFDPEDKGSAKVYYFEGDISKLERREFLNDLPEDFKFPEIALEFKKRDDMPSYEEFYDLHPYEDYEEFYEVKEAKGHNYDEEISKLLGYADCIQGEMLTQCELVTNGIYCGSGLDLTEEELSKFEEKRDEWQLLFQLDTVTKGNFELMFGDCGRLYYYIKKEDLKNKNFDNVWMISQCS